MAVRRGGPSAVHFGGWCGLIAVQGPTNSHEHRRTVSSETQRFGAVRPYSLLFAVLYGNRGDLWCLAWRLGIRRGVGGFVSGVGASPKKRPGPRRGRVSTRNGSDGDLVLPTHQAAVRRHGPRIRVVRCAQSR